MILDSKSKQIMKPLLLTSLAAYDRQTASIVIKRVNDCDFNTMKA